MIIMGENDRAWGSAAYYERLRSEQVIAAQNPWSSFSAFASTQGTPANGTVLEQIKE